MGISTLILICLGGLFVLVGGIMLLVAAFRESLAWGLSVLFLPFANLIFVIAHWAEAKSGFVTSLAGGILIGIAVAIAPTPKAVAAPGPVPALPVKVQPVGFKMERIAQVAAATPTPTPALDLTAQIQEHRDRIEKLETRFAQEGEALVRDFKALSEQRSALQSGDAASVNAFNNQAAAYQARNVSSKKDKEELDAFRAELEVLLDQRARGKGGTAARSSAKRVVMYTTATCPACKAAKSYLAQKNVPYDERDVNQSPQARAEYQKLGGRGVPLILVGNERVDGFSAQQLDQLL